MLYKKNRSVWVNLERECICNNYCNDDDDMGPEAYSHHDKLPPWWESRGLEHQDSLRNEREDSPLWKHCQLVHNGEKQTFSMSVVGSFQSCLERQINEAVRISSNTADHILNSKSEFHQAPIVRVVTTNGLQTEQGEEEVVVRGRGGGHRAERGQ